MKKRMKIPAGSLFEMGPPAGAVNLPGEKRKAQASRPFFLASHPMVLQPYAPPTHT